MDRYDPKMQNVLNNYVEVHYQQVDGSIASTGNSAADGRLDCITPTCSILTASGDGSQSKSDDTHISKHIPSFEHISSCDCHGRQER
jgi:hypothetical protein